jgi:hypothetical protein
MTGSDSQATRDEREPEGSGVSPLKRVVEWFWRGAALSDERKRTALPGQRAQLLAERARASADAATVTYTSKHSESSLEAIACELYRQSAYWAACASTIDSQISTSVVDAQVWDKLEERLFAPPEGGVKTSDAVRELARSGSFIEFAELPRERLRPVLLSLRALSSALLKNFNERGARLRELRTQRILRVGSVLLLMFGIVQGVLVRPRFSELAAGKSWRASSDYGGGCTSPQQTCPEDAGYFFHTRENDENPWIEFDLEATRRISTVEVDNRQDCCTERALPLVIEISQDHQTWKSVARRDANFSTWRATFDSVSARWVRLRVLKTSAFHLRAVRIYP